MKPIKIVIVLFVFVTIGSFTMACSEHRISRLSAETPLDYY